MEVLNYEEYVCEIWERLKKAKTIVLATTEGDKIHTRLVAPIIDGMNILISTGGKSKKVQQILKNPNVAIACDELNIEAITEVYGHPSTYPNFQEVYAIQYPEYVSTYPSNPEDVVVICKPQVISRYQYPGKPCKAILDLVEKKAYRIEL